VILGGGLDLLQHPQQPEQELDEGDQQTIHGLLIERLRPGLRITRPWSKIAGYASLAWVALWFGVIHFFTSLGQQSSDVPYLLALPGIAMGYVALTRLFNRTVIEIGAGRISLRHQPLPWFGRRHFAIAEVYGLHTEIRKIYAKGHTVAECWIFIVRGNGKKTMLLKGIELSVAQMNYIAGVMCNYLEVPFV
jgi:hypothetical protein